MTNKPNCDKIIKRKSADGINMNVIDLYKDQQSNMNKPVKLEGWIRNHRKQKSFGFIDFHDGTCFKTVQIVYSSEYTNGFDDVQKLKNGSSVEVFGTMVPSEAKGQAFEVKADTVKLIGDSPDDYPIQPKRHTREFLREQAYLRARTNLFQAVFRIRSVAAMAIHTFLQDRGFVYVHTPIFTDSDCEGAGEMFLTTTMPLSDIPKTEEGAVDFSGDFFGKKVGLTVSGQFEGECFAMAFKNIYTFGPTFRAENSNTKTHACEFWQIEPEMAFCDLEGLMEVQEALFKFICKYVLDKCPDEIKFLDGFVQPGLKEKLETMTESKSARVTHEEAITILKNSGKDWEFPPEYGQDIAKEHEKYLTDDYFRSPVFVTDWPRDIKSFYMKQSADGKTVAGVDYLVPGAGEMMGGSQREEDYDKLLAEMKRRNMNIDELYWYTNLRKWGTCKHSGFGMGFERLLMYLTGIDNIRDVLPFPRTPGNCSF